MKAIRQARGLHAVMVLLTGTLAVGMHACSNGSSVSGPGGTGGAGTGGAGPLGSGGSVSTGGTVTTGGAPASGGSMTTGGTAPITTGGTSAGGAASGGAAAGGAATGGGGGAGGADCSMAPGSTTLDPSTFPACPQCMDKPAHCLPKSIVMQIAPDQFAQLAECNATDVCVPDVFIKTLGKYKAPSCTSISDGAGRCLSECIGAVANLGTFLPKATCGDGEKCAPCIDPRNGMPTGACSLPCDSGPKEPGPVFAKCCTDKSGICVPPDILDATQAKALAADTCSTGNVCAPAVFADSSFKAKVCASVAGAEGRCLSNCVDLVKRNSELLPKDVCADGELCAPCTDPRTGELTAACTLNGDKPTKPPIVFKTECCDTTGLCVPKTAVPARYTKLLPPDVCGGDGGGADYVCAPKLKLNDLSVRLPKCQVLLAGIPVPAGDPNQFGACIPQCIADAQIAANPIFATALAPSDCMAGWVCAPCINPLDQSRTGACD